MEKKFEQFRIASGLSGDTEPRQVSTLLYCLGENAEDVLNSTNITDADKERYQPVIQKFDEFFQVRRNVIFERARFNRRNQLDGESIEEYLTALYSLVENCDYGALRDQLLRDRIVVGIRDTSLSERLQLDPTLTLEKARTMVRAVAIQGKQLRGDGSQVSPFLIEPVGSHRPTSAVTTSTRQPYIRNTNSRDGRGRSFTSRDSSECTCCGKNKHDRGDTCPARDAVCHRCNRRGHFSTRCYSKTVANIDAESNESSMDTAFLGAVNHSNPLRSWTVPLYLFEKEPSNLSWIPEQR